MTGTHQLAALSFWRRLFGVSASPANTRLLSMILVVNLVAAFINIVLRDSIGKAGAAAVIVAVGLLALIVLGVFGWLRNPAPVIDFDAGVLRVASEATPFRDIDEAAIVHTAANKRDELSLWFGGHGRRHTMVVLRSGSDALSDHDRQVLASMVERSSVQLPAPKRDPYDPKGRFSWLDQQGYATKEQVLDAVLNTPATGDIMRTT